MRATVKQVPSGRTAKLYTVEVGGRVVALLERYPDRRGSTNPWKVYAMDGTHPQTGAACAGTLVGCWYADAGGRGVALAQCAELAAGVQFGACDLATSTPRRLTVAAAA